MTETDVILSGAKRSEESISHRSKERVHSIHHCALISLSLWERVRVRGCGYPTTPHPVSAFAETSLSLPRRGDGGEVKTRRACFLQALLLERTDMVFSGLFAAEAIPPAAHGAHRLLRRFGNRLRCVAHRIHQEVWERRWTRTA